MNRHHPMHATDRAPAARPHRYQLITVIFAIGREETARTFARPASQPLPTHAGAARMVADWLNRNTWRKAPIRPGQVSVRRVSTAIAG